MLNLVPHHRASRACVGAPPLKSPPLKSLPFKSLHFDAPRPRPVASSIKRLPGLHAHKTIRIPARHELIGESATSIGGGTILREELRTGAARESFCGAILRKVWSRCCRTMHLTKQLFKASSSGPSAPLGQPRWVVRSLGPELAARHVSAWSLGPHCPEQCLRGPREVSAWSFGPHCLER